MITHLLLVVVHIVLLMFLFRGGRSPSPPGPASPPNYMIVKHPFKGTQIPGTYTIYTLKNLLSRDEAKLLEIAAVSTLRRSGTISQNPVSKVRTSYNTFLDTDHFEGTEVHGLLKRIEHAAGTLSGKPVENQEPLQVVRYMGGEYYKEHYDACVPENSEMCTRDARGCGMRYATLLIYMNDVEPDNGGETYFPMVDAKFRPQVGSGVFFFNLRPNDRNAHHPLSKHASLPLKGGVKWVCNKWIRSNDYRLHQ